MQIRKAAGEGARTRKVTAAGTISAVQLKGMKRVTIVGVQASGKSTLARELGAILGIGVTVLDELYWRPGWVAPFRAEWEEIERRLVTHEAWILDGQVGNALERSDLRLAAADTVILVDRSPAVCVLHLMRRLVFQLGQEVAPGCPVRIEWKSFPWILTYRFRYLPAVLRKLEDFGYGRRIVVLRTRADTLRFLEQVRAAANSQAR